MARSAADTLLQAARGGELSTLAEVLGAAPLDEAVLAQAVLAAVEAPDAASALRLLLAAGAKPDAASNGDGETALLVALRRCEFGAAKLLLQAGASMHATNKQGQGAAQLVARDPALLAALAGAAAGASRASAPTPPSRPDTPPLIAATKQRARDLVGAALRDGAPVDAVDADGQTALHYASEAGDSDIVAALIDHGAVVDTRGPAHRTALHSAAIKNRDKVMRLLLAAGASVDARDVQRRTPLLLASLASKERACRLLVGAGADVNAADEWGETPLTWIKKAATSAVGQPRRVAQELLRLYREAAPAVRRPGTPRRR